MKDLGLQDKPGRQIFHFVMKKAFKPVIDAVEEVSCEVKKTMVETSKEGIKLINRLNAKLLEAFGDKGISASFLGTPLINLFKPEQECQSRLLIDSFPVEVNDFLMNAIKSFTF